jgi:hypothetical protein
MALNEIRSTVTVDSLLRKSGSIIEAASGLAYLSNALAGELCGSAPTPDEPTGRGEKAVGKLDVLDAILDTIAEHQRRTRYSLGRLDRVIRESEGQVESADMPTASYVTKDRY